MRLITPASASRRVLAVAGATALVLGLGLPSLAADRGTPAQAGSTAAFATKVYEGLRNGPGLAGVAVPVQELRQVERAQQLVKGPGGQSVPVRLAPAETGGSLETLDGFTVLRGADGTWRYAVPAAGGPVPSGAVAGRDPVPAGLQPGLGRRTSAQVSPEQQANAQAQAELMRQAQIASAQAQASATVDKPREFTFPVLMLSTWWSSEKGQSAPQFQPGSNTVEHFKKILDGFGGNPTGTLTEFYFEDSFGTFLVKVDVLGTYTSNRSRQDRCYYGGISPGDGGTDLDLLDDVLGVGGGGALGMAIEAVPQADPGVDFSKYDNDKNGVVDFVGIIHSGADMAVTGDPCNTWSHALQASLATGIIESAAGLQPGELKGGLPTSDGVIIDRLFTMPEFDEPGGALQIGVATHEMAHALGEPDYYNTAYTSNGTGNWDIMAGGSYGGNPSGSNPLGFNPASRVFQGWITPTLVQGDLRGVKVEPRRIRPAGFDPAKPSPSLYLVPVKEMGVGDKDAAGYTWTTNDVYGLVKNPDTGKYVVEGYYLENVSRMASRAPISPQMSRAPYFDRAAEGSGLLVWHFDYWLRSNVYYGSNNAQTDANRPQMDPMEFDFNDNTQELQLNKSRGNADDVMYSAATGITSGTRLLPPGAKPPAAGTPTAATPFSGVVPPTQTSDSPPLTYVANPADRQMRVRVTGTGDCTLQLLKNGKPMGAPVDSGFVGGEELIVVPDPEPAKYVARVGDFAGCLNYTGRFEFVGSDGVVETKGAADTWSNWTGQPTGWAFTNVGPAAASGLDHAADAGGDEAITLDIVNLGADRSDVSPGFVTGAPNARGGTMNPTAGAASPMTVPVFNNGGKPVDAVQVTVREGSASGQVVATGTVNAVGAYTRKAFDFTWKPTAEGAQTLVVQVTAVGDAVANDVQATELWAGPAGPKVLVVDDDGALDQEAALTGALAANGVPYAVVTEHPTAEQMAAFPAVFWEASQDRAVGQLDAGDVAALTTYLDGGGRLFLASNRVVDALATPPGRTNPGASDKGAEFATKYLGALPSSTGPKTFNADVEASLSGVLGTGTVRITQSPGRQFLGPMKAAGGAKPVLGQVQPLVTAAGAPTGDLLGVAVTGSPAAKGFRTVTLGYNPAQHTSPDATTAVVRSVLGFFGVPTGAPLAGTSEAVVHHSAVRNQVSGRPVDVRAVVLGGAAGRPVLLHYRAHGNGSWSTVPMTAGAEPGSFSAQIPASVVTPQSVDYYIQAGAASTYDPPAARDRSVVHAISVALPEQPGSTLPPGAGTGSGTGTAGSAGAGSGVPSTRAATRGTGQALAATGGAPLLAAGGLLLVGLAVAGRRLRR